MNYRIFLLACLSLTAGLSAQTTRPTTRPADGSDARNLSADQMLDQMLKPTTQPSHALEPVPDRPTRDRSGGRGAVKPDAPQVNLVREGTYVIDRVARLTHTEKDRAEISFESDGKTLKDPPMIILPNQKLMMMEDAVNSASRDLKFRVTGMVTEYRGRNYILLEKASVIPDAQQQF